MEEIVKKDDLPVDQQSEEAYLSIRGYVIDAQRQVYSAVNAAMVTAYWNIGSRFMEFAVRAIVLPTGNRS